MAGSTTIESNDFTLEDLFKSFYSVPDFQREYVWEPQHVDKLLEDAVGELYDGNNNPVPDSEYFIGSIVTYRDAQGVYQLIDGQQRLTTSYLVLCAIRDSLIELGTTPGESLTRMIADSSLDPMTGEDVHRFRLALQYEDSRDVLAGIASKPGAVAQIPETTSSVRHILAAYRSIRDFLSANFRDDVPRIRAFMAAFTTRIKLIRIDTPDLSRALKLFETINDRGLGLTAMDLLKNLLFMHVGAHDYGQLKNRWKALTDTLDKCREKPLRFLRYYILSHYEIDLTKPIREDEIYPWFAKHESDTGINQDPLVFLEDLVSCGHDYARFVASKSPTGEPNRYLRNIAILSNQARQHFILLLAARKLPREVFEELCRRIENLFFCYVIAREPTKNFERSFTRWARDLRQVTDGEGLSAFIERYLEPDLRERSTRFDFAFSELATTNIQQYRMKYILAKLTQYVDQKAWGSAVSDSLERYLDGAVQIEHILPQSPGPGLRESFDKPEEYDQYKVRMGNLALIEKTINPSISNRHFSEKKAGYQQSALLLTKSLVERPHVGTDTQLNRAVRDLIQFDTWTSLDIERRQEMLGALARRVWEMPELAQEGTEAELN